MKLGIVSSGKIISEFLTLLPLLPEISVTSMCVRPESRERAESLLDSAGVTGAEVFTDFEKFITRGDFDFMYSGNANHMHFPQGKLALLAGRNVIMEKPITCSPEDTDTLSHLALERGLWLFEAITTIYTPVYAFMRERLPAVGPVRAVTMNFSKRSSRYGDYLQGKYSITFDPALFGGALNDMGVYNMFLAAGLFGAPRAVMYLPNTGTTGADMSGTALWKYEGFAVTMVTAKDSDAPCGCVIQGDEGRLELRGCPNSMDSSELILRDGRRESLDCGEHRMLHEFRAFNRMWTHGDRAGMEESLRLSRLVTRLLCLTGESRGRLTPVE